MNLAHQNRPAFQVIEEGQGERLCCQRIGDNEYCYELQEAFQTGGQVDWVTVAAEHQLHATLGLQAVEGVRARIVQRFPLTGMALPLAVREYNGHPLGYVDQRKARGRSQWHK